eukprot:jgi/Botrbrau1/13998/Bobra.150_1s0009.1
MMSLLILYASQTGNAQDVAERVSREAKARHFVARIFPMDTFNVACLPEEPFVVFIASTTGQGDPPNNMLHFWRFLLRKSLPANSLINMHYAVFGLGDSGYMNYNVVAKKLDRRLLALGGVPLIERGLGDDQHSQGYEAALDPWLQQLWSAVRSIFPLPAGLTEPAPGDTRTELLPKYRVSLLPSEEAARNNGSSLSFGEEVVQTRKDFAAFDAAACTLTVRADQDTQTGRAPLRPFWATVLKNERVTAAEHFQDVRHIELKVMDSDMAYQPGDLLGMYPEQDPAVVEELLKHLGLDGDTQVRVELAEPATGSAPTCVKATRRALLAALIDVGGASPRRYFFEVLKAFATNSLEAERLEHFASPEGMEDLYRYNQAEGRTLLEVMKDFPSSKPPFEWILQAGPKLKARQFSIASSLAAHPGQAHLLVAVVSHRTSCGRLIRGLCSAWLASLTPGKDQIPVWVEKGMLRLPPAPVPMILVGPGTGVAPFRSFLEERHVRKSKDPGYAGAPSVLIFGCRNEARDYYFRAQWEQLVKDGTLDRRIGLLTAFSRDSDQKVYVTHQIREHAPELWNLLQEGAVIYVAGSAKNMPSDVAKAFEDVVAACGGMTKAEAEKHVRQLKDTGRYFVEAWS